MPYKTVKRGKGYAVVNKKTGKVKSTSSTKSGAKRSASKANTAYGKRNPSSSYGRKKR